MRHTPIILILLTCSSLSFGQGADWPRIKFVTSHSFEHFRISEIDHAKKAALDLTSNVDGRNYRTVLSNAFKADSSNFAGHYSFVRYGTGTSALKSKIIDRQSGKVYDGPDSNHGYEFRLDSRMIITNPPDSLGFYDDCSYCHPMVYVLDEATKQFEKLTTHKSSNKK
jgi:hypothetical protein